MSGPAYCARRRLGKTFRGEAGVRTWEDRQMEFCEVVLRVPRDAVNQLRAFYERLGLEILGEDRYAIGPARLCFAPAAGRPFYHFAWLVPGDRFQAALAWAGEEVDLLPGGDIDDVIFDFQDWDALACYFHDPAGNIVELIAHRGIGETDASGRFDPAELLGFSELGLVGDPPAMASRLSEPGLQLWDGELDEPGRLAFIGERARTLILSPEGRGWLPTGRPAEPHPVDVVLSGPIAGEVRAGGHRIRVKSQNRLRVS